MRVMTGDAHDRSVPYAEVIAAAPSVDLEAWECRTHVEGNIVHYYAKGPCPGCGAQVQGHIADDKAPIESQGKPERATESVAPSEPVGIEVPLNCTCGSTHGSDGAHGCGRRWSIVCPRERR